MCGIVGLYLKTSALESQLGALFEPMLLSMGERGPDSAGFAIYRDSAPAGQLKFTIQDFNACDEAPAWLADLQAAFGEEPAWTRNASAVILTTAIDEAALRQWLTGHAPDALIMSVGSSIEILKDVGHPREVAARFQLRGMHGTHVIGHTRMATESAVSLAGSHPFSTGHDLCLVHNGSLSNHNQLRRRLVREGFHFDTSNDSEVAAAFLTSRLRAGDSLTAALERALEEIDGFFTFTIGTRDGFAVVRDPIACKPAVLAETAEWVAMASEYRALAGLPGIADARVWEPEPAVVYAWESPRSQTATNAGTTVRGVGA
jgi:methylamine---glutamate N-methyltransferase subunit A